MASIINTNIIGINNSSPSYSLDVDGQIRTGDSDTQGAIIFGNGNNANETWLVSSTLTSSPAPTFTLPVDSGNDGDYLTVDANGNLIWTSPTEQDDFVVDNSTGNNARQIAFFEGSNTISGSSMSFTTDGDLSMSGGITSTTISTGDITSSGDITATNVTASGTVTANTGVFTNLDINNSLTVSQVTISNPDGGTLNLFSTGVTNVSLTFPGDDGDSGEFLQTDGSGNLSWVDPFNGDTFVIDGSSVDPTETLAFFTGSGTISGTSISYNNSTNELTTPGGITSASITTGDINSSGDISASSVSASSMTATDADFTNLTASGTINAPFGSFDNLTTNSSVSSATIIADFVSSSNASFTDAQVDGQLTSNTLSTEHLRLEDSETTNYINLEAPDNLADNYSLTFPANAGTANQFLQTDGNGVLTWADAATSSTFDSDAILDPDGTSNGIYYNNSGTLTSFDGIVVDNSNTFFGINTSSPSYSLDVDGQIRSGDSDTQGTLILGNGQNGFDSYLIADPNVTSSPTIVLPNASGTILTTGNLGATNGITFASNSFSLGGQLTGNTAIDLNGNTLEIDGSGGSTTFEANGNVTIDADLNVDSGNITSGTGATSGSITLNAGTGGFVTTLSGSSTATESTDYILPGADGINAQVLATNGQGDLYWRDAGSSGGTDILGVVSDSPGNGTLDPYLIDETNSFIRLEATGGTLTIDGIDATGVSDGQRFVIVNVGASNNIRLRNDQATDPADGILTGGGTIVLTPNGTATIIYDSTSAKWRVIASN